MAIAVRELRRLIFISQSFLLDREQVFGALHEAAMGNLAVCFPCVKGQLLEDIGAPDGMLPSIRVRRGRRASYVLQIPGKSETDAVHLCHVPADRAKDGFKVVARCCRLQRFGERLSGQHLQEQERALQRVVASFISQPDPRRGQAVCLQDAVRTCLVGDAAMSFGRLG